MQSLTGVFIKSQNEEQVSENKFLYPFMLIFPNKKRIYYLQSEEERDEWINKIKDAIGYSNLFDYYDLFDSIGKGKYGLVKKGVHKTSGKEVAVKIIKKKELKTTDIEML